MDYSVLMTQLIITGLAILIMILSAVFINKGDPSTKSPNTKGKKTSITQLIVVIIVAVSTYFLSSNIAEPLAKLIHYEKTTKLENENKEKGIINDLIGAEIEIDADNFEEAAKIYMRHLDNPVALNNLGVMYSKGMYLPQNTSKAIDYFMLAEAGGLEVASSNLLCVYMRSGYKSGFRILIQKHISDPIVSKFLDRIVKSLHNEISKEEFVELSPDETKKLMTGISETGWYTKKVKYKFLAGNENRENFTRLYVGSTPVYTKTGDLFTYYLYIEKTRIYDTDYDKSQFPELWPVEEFAVIQKAPTGSGRFKVDYSGGLSNTILEDLRDWQDGQLERNDVE